jgi:flagellar biosynthesis protein FliR
VLSFITQQYIFNFFLIITRLIGLLSLLPGLGDERISVRIKIFIYVMITICSMNFVEGYLPKYTNLLSLLAYYIIAELIVGIMLGICVRIYFSSILVLGNLISMESGLSAATIYDSTQKEQIMLFSSFIASFALAVIFSSDSHHHFIAGFLESYEKFKPGFMLDMNDIANKIVLTVSQSFLLAFRISAPFLIVGMAILIISGVLSRIMPSLQVLFVITPVQIIVMFSILYIVINNIISQVIESMIGAF